MELAHLLGLPYRKGFVKTRYVDRTFIMPGQGVGKKSVRQKLNAGHEYQAGGKHYPRTSVLGFTNRMPWCFPFVCVWPSHLGGSQLKRAEARLQGARTTCRSRLSVIG